MKSMFVACVNWTECLYVLEFQIKGLSLLRVYISILGRYSVLVLELHLHFYVVFLGKKKSGNIIIIVISLYLFI